MISRSPHVIAALLLMVGFVSSAAGQATSVERPKTRMLSGVVLSPEGNPVPDAVPSVEVDSHYDFSSRVLTYRLTNISSGNITAYGMHFCSVWSDGDTGCASLVQGSPGEGIGMGRWRPGQQFSGEVNGPKRADADLIEYHVEVSSALFEDLTFEGAWEEVEKILISVEESQIARSYWLNSLEQVLANARTEKQLRAELGLMIQRIGLKDAFHYLNGRVSRKSDGAQGMELTIQENLQTVLTIDLELVGMGFRELVESFVAEVRADFEAMSKHVSHDVRGELIRQPKLRRDNHGNR